MAAPKKRTPAKQPGRKTPKKVSAISAQDAGLLQGFLRRIDLKGEEVPAFNRVQSIIGHACGVQELPDEVLYPQPNSR